MHRQDTWMLSLRVTLTKMIRESLYIYTRSLYNRNSKTLVKISYEDNITCTENLLSLPHENWKQT